MKNLFLWILLIFSETISVFGQEIDTLKVSKSDNRSSFLKWLVIIFIVFIVISAIIIIIRRLKKPKHVFEVPDDWRNRNHRHDFSDVFRGVSGDARVLYRELITRCHPDRFIGDPEKIEISTNLSGEITRNRHNFSRLLELKIRAREELNIDF
jgi:hypothetical protein